ncbi:MAG: hypothetical protein NWE81_00230 [Candidatus Bathyarchaeota archaeon]|nr:hypothetical protein [Candidatus Bathyarchaeota archaeon]
MRTANLIGRSKSLGLCALLIGISASLLAVGELSGEFATIRQLASQPLNVVTVMKGEVIPLYNGILFSFDVDNASNDMLKVVLPTNQTFIWFEPIQKGSRVFKSENFTLDGTDCSFEVDITVTLYDEQTMQLIDETRPHS